MTTTSLIPNIAPIEAAVAGGAQPTGRDVAHFIVATRLRIIALKDGDDLLREALIELDRLDERELKTLAKGVLKGVF